MEPQAPTIPDTEKWQAMEPPSHLELKLHWRKSRRCSAGKTNKHGWKLYFYKCFHKDKFGCPAEIREVHLPHGEIIFQTNGQEHDDSGKSRIDKSSGPHKRRKAAAMKALTERNKELRRLKLLEQAGIEIEPEKPVERPCLFCWKLCPEQKFKESPAFGGDKVPGQEHSTELGKQLQSFFVLNKLLGIERSWCEEVMTEDLSFLMDSWFLVCDGCMEYVREAWRLHQKIVAFQKKFENVKKKLKEGLKQSAFQNPVEDASMIENRIRRVVLSSGSSNTVAPTDQGRGRIEVVIKKEVPVSSPPASPTPSYIHEEQDDYEESPITPPTPSAIGSPPSSPGTCDASAVSRDCDYIPEGFDYEDSNLLKSPPSPSEHDESDEDFVPPSKSRPKSKPSSTPTTPKKNSTISTSSQNEDPFARKKCGRPKGWRKDPNREYKPLGRPRIKPKVFGPKRTKSFPRPDSWQKCPQCTYRYNSKRNLQVHLDLHKERKRNNETMNPDLNCIVCTYPATTAKELEQHFHKRKHRNPKMTAEGWMCRNGTIGSCNFVTKDLDEMRTHLFTVDHSLEASRQKKMKIEEENVILEMIEKELKEKKAAEKLEAKKRKLKEKLPRRRRANPYCDTCQTRFRNETILERHLNLHKERDGMEHRLNCSQCQYPAWDKIDLHHHLRKKHGHIPDPRRCASHVCPESGCDFHAKSYLLLESHMLTHTTKIEEPYVPQPPSRQFRGRVPGAKKKKSQSNSNSGKTYRCAVCGYTATTFAVMRKHRLNHKNIICEVCGQSFMKNDYLKAHMNLVHYEVEETPCPYCRKIFPCLARMRSHVYRYCLMNPNLKCYKSDASRDFSSSNDANNVSSISNANDNEVSCQSLSVKDESLPEQYNYNLC